MILGLVAPISIVALVCIERIAVLRLRLVDISAVAREAGRSPVTSIAPVDAIAFRRPADTTPTVVVTSTAAVIGVRLILTELTTGMPGDLHALP
tara:strand:- start:1026 stop:1307 length:282 start_codon:yes stop_codon:yes gene_type:complete